MNILRPSVIQPREWHKDRDPAQWAMVKAHVLARDHFTCTYCRLCCKKFMQVNHIGAEDDHRSENLETVCRACHSVLHLGISSMHGVLSVFECTSAGNNVAGIVCVTRSLVHKKTPWNETESAILSRFGVPSGRRYTSNESISYANQLLHAIKPPHFRAYLPDGLAVMFHEEGEWNNFPEPIWKWQCMQGSHYRKEEK